MPDGGNDGGGAGATAAWGATRHSVSNCGKRECVRVNHRPCAIAFQKQLSAGFEGDNIVHSHSDLGMSSPREFITPQSPTPDARLA